MNALGYNAPARLAELVAAAGHAPQRAWRVIDLSCGSGLAGGAFRDFARHLVGSALSPRMIEIARARRLRRAPRRGPHGHAAPGRRGVDLAVASDVFICVGALDEPFRAAASALGVRPQRPPRAPSFIPARREVRILSIRHQRELDEP